MDSRQDAHYLTKTHTISTTQDGTCKDRGRGREGGREEGRERGREGERGRGGEGGRERERGGEGERGGLKGADWEAQFCVLNGLNKPGPLDTVEKTHSKINSQCLNKFPPKLICT